MSLAKKILEITKNPEEKTLLQIDNRDDQLTIELSSHFKNTHEYYLFLDPLQVNDSTSKKVIFKDIIKNLHKFDVILLDNDFHHFPNIWQMEMLDALISHQELLLVEWNLKGNIEYYYSSFEDCKPLCKITRDILDKFVKNNNITISYKTLYTYQLEVLSQKEMIDYFQFILPEHWRFGEKEFMRKIANLTYPFLLWEEYIIYKIEKRS